MSKSSNAAAATATVGDRLLRFLGRLKTPASRKRLGWASFANVLDGNSIRHLFLVVVLSALSGTVVLYLLNTESRLVEEDEYSRLAALGFIALLLVYRFSQRRLITRASESIEAALHVWRERIFDKVTRLSLRDMEDISHGQLLDGLSRHYAPLSQSIVTIVAGLEATVLLFFMYVYLVLLSPAAALLTVIVAVLCVAGYMNLAARLSVTMSETSSLSGRLDRLADSSIKGAKELRLNASKREAVLNDMDATSEELYKSRSDSAGIFAEVISSGNTASYLMAGGVVFVLPLVSSTEQSQISQIVMAVIFLIGPIGGMIGSLQQLSIAGFAARSILAFESDIDARLSEGTTALSSDDYADFKSIVLRAVSYQHHCALDQDKPFAVHDINLTIARGSLIFITGGNGSGKTTVLRVLTGLYPRDHGTISVDNAEVSERSSQNYRNLFSTVFADFHVFNRAYGLDSEGMARMEYWLDSLRIRNKLPADLTSGFNPEALSTGQRKRLALAMALAEDRPVLVLDEWAADQDPATRSRFYEEILPALQKAGKTIIAVSHDERYFQSADVHVHMEDGNLSIVRAARVSKT